MIGILFIYMKNSFEMSPEQIKADEAAIAAVRERNLAKQAEGKKPEEESFDWNEGGRVMDTSTAKVLAKDRTEHEQSAIKSILEKIKRGF